MKAWNKESKQEVKKHQFLHNLLKKIVLPANRISTGYLRNADTDLMRKKYDEFLKLHEDNN